jgi:group I intron endonuclease
MRFTVYRITCLVTGKAYIGITKFTAERRWRSHQSAARKKLYRSLLHQAILKYGADQFRITTLCVAHDRKEAGRIERALIAAYGTRIPNGYNITLGGEGTHGIKRHHSPETRRKISEGNKGRRTGLVLSKETRAKLSASKMGHPVSVAARAKIGAAFRGRKHTPQHVINSTRRGWRHTPATKAKIAASERATKAKRKPTPRQLSLPLLEPGQ